MTDVGGHASHRRGLGSGGSVGLPRGGHTIVRHVRNVLSVVRGHGTGACMGRHQDSGINVPDGPWAVFWPRPIPRGPSVRGHSGRALVRWNLVPSL